MSIDPAYSERMAESSKGLSPIGNFPRRFPRRQTDEFRLTKRLTDETFVCLLRIKFRKVGSLPRRRPAFWTPLGKKWDWLGLRRRESWFDGSSGRCGTLFGRGSDRGDFPF